MMADEKAGGTRRSTRAAADAKATTTRAKTTHARASRAGVAVATRDALAEEHEKLAAVEAALAHEREQRAALEEQLERERLRADKAAAALEAARQQAAPPREPHKPGEKPGEKAGEKKPTGDDILPAWMRPFNVLPPLPGSELFAAGQPMAALGWPFLAMQQTGEMLSEATRIATGQSQIAPEKGDRRFTDEQWQSNPLYKAALQTYLLWRKSLNSFVDSAQLPKKDADRARFALSLVTEAVAPTNTLLGNPAAMRQFFETGGASAVRGVTHMIEDLAQNGGMPSQVDMAAFEVGKDLARSQGAVVYTDEIIELIQYAPQTETVFARPILAVPPQINKFYVLDLSPGKSIVEHLTRSGFTVFAISWRNPTPRQRAWGFDTYVKAVLKAADVAREITGQEAVNTVGACAGGATLALALGHLAAKGDTRINAATFMVTVLDSRVESTMGLFATPETVAAAKLVSNARGVLEGQEMARVFAWLRPNDLIWNYWVNNYLIGNDPAAFDILYWNNDTTRLSAKFHGELVDLAVENPLITPGKLKTLGTPIDLRQVKLDAFITAGITDHITPWQGCYATTQMLGGKKEFILSQAGHIQSIINPPGNPKARYFTGAEYPADAEQWLARAEQRSGSWWERWRDWLGERSGERKPAPSTLGSDQHPAGASAPGTYIFEP
ncbi:MAG: alpha/beta fold hydrolase [Ktedonobacterales bacterium]